MEHNDEDYIGKPLEEVPKRDADEKCNGRKKQRRDRELLEDDQGRKLFAGYCRQTSGWGTDSDHGRCRKHGGNGGPGDGNDNAVDHGAYREDFLDHLTESEQELVEDLYDGLETKEDAQEVARFAASLCLTQFRRSDFDERFMRRFESICDKAGIFPNDELDVNHDGLESMFMSNLKDYHEDSEDDS